MAPYTLYYMPTPNGKKISLALEEMGVSYDIVNINILKGDQFTDSFKSINPNSKIPALVDHTAEGGELAIFESGAILEYLADKAAKFLPATSDIHKRMAVKQWLYWQVGGFGPMMGQLNFFHVYSKEDVPVGKARYLKEAVRLFAVLDKQLSENKYIAGEEYSIADMATYWWALGVSESEKLRSNFEGFPHVKSWLETIGSRDAVAKVNAIPWDA